MALLASLAGCSTAPEEESPLYPVRDGRGILTYRYKTHDPPVPEVATTLTASQLEQQRQYEEERRWRLRERQADEAVASRIWQDQEREESLQRLRDQQAYEDLRRRDRQARRWQEQQQQRLGRQGQWLQHYSQRGEAESRRLQQASQELDQALQRLRPQQGPQP